MSARRVRQAPSERAAQFLAAVSGLLASSFDLSSILPQVAKMAVGHLADCCIIEMVDDEGNPHLAAVATKRAREARDVRAWAAALEEREGAMPALDALTAASREGLHFEPVVVETLEAHGRRVGALALARSSSSQRDGPMDSTLVRELALRVATCIDNAQRYMRERRVARSFQTALLPRSFPKMSGRSFHASYSPATNEAEVGGDWYDAFDLPDGRLAMSIGDVAGHGLEAAVVMGEVRQTFRVAAMENRDPGAVLDMANRLLLLRPQATMVTAIFGTYDGQTFTYASAGHPPPIIGTVEGGVHCLPIAGIPLGVDGTQGRGSWTATLPPDSLLVLYTDGLIEYERDPVAGEEKLREAVAAELAAPTANPARSISQAVLGNMKNMDDVAVLTFSVEAAPMPELNLHYTAAPVTALLVRQAVSRFASEMGLTEDQKFSLNVAIGEAVNNVIEHAYLSTPGTFSVRAWREDHKIIVSVEDRGTWRRARSEGRGRGLHMMRALMSGVEVSLSQGNTVVKMVYDIDGTGEK